MSGAAVPESEIKAFRKLFAVSTTDTPETIRYKLNRSIDIVNDLENLMLYGSDTGQINSFVADEKAKLNQREAQSQRVSKPVKEGQSFGGISESDLTPEERQALITAGML